MIAIEFRGKGDEKRLKFDRLDKFSNLCFSHIFIQGFQLLCVWVKSINVNMYGFGSDPLSRIGFLDFGINKLPETE